MRISPEQLKLLRNFPPLEVLLAEQARRTAERERKRVEDNAEEIRARCHTLIGFVKEAWPVLHPATPYVFSWHHRVIAEHLEAVTRSEILRLQINEPPRCLKSVIASVMWEAWEWGPAGLPGMRYFTTSYTDTYVRRDSRMMRDLVQSPWYQALWPHVKLIRDSESNFENAQKGFRVAQPFGSLTGGGGNRVVLDDPHSVDQAESDADRQAAVRRFRESVSSRLDNQLRDAIIVIMHRLHPDDICGEIERLELPYVKLVLPMEYVRSTTVGTRWFTDPRTEDGEILLPPERMTREALERNKLELGPHAYDTQYQQMPRAREGSYFFSREQLLVERGAAPDGTKIYEPAEAPKRCDAVAAVIDTATKTGKSRDGTGVMFFAYRKYPQPSAVILDWDLQQIEGSLLTVWLPTVFQRLEQLARECGAKAGSLGAFIEDKDSGQVLLQHAANARWPARAIDSKLTALGKDGRAMSVSGYVNRGLIKISRAANDKVTVYKGRSRNHLLYQVTTYRMGVGTTTDEDELFDCFCYSCAVAFGNVDGF